jgi:CBS domain-containing protein
MLIRHTMTERPIACSSVESLAEAVRIMWEHDCGSVPIIDEHGVVVGIVTDRDACVAAYTQDRRLHDLPVTIAMSHAIIACHPEEPVSAAMDRMREHQVRRLPVIDNGGHLLGMISLSDLARHGAATQEVAETLRAICRPRTRAAA